MRIINANASGELKLGRQGEDERTIVRFDVSDLAAEFPGGLVSIATKRPRDSVGHLAGGVTRTGDVVEWLVDDYELERYGDGKVQLIYSVSDVVAKTKIWPSHVGPSVSATASVPPDWMDVVNTLLQAAGNVTQLVAQAEDARDDALSAQAAAEDARDTAVTAQGAAETAQGAAETAQGAAETAQRSAAGSATLSESWAVGGTGTRAGEDTNSSYYWAQVAQQQAQIAGCILADVDDSTGQLVITTTNQIATDIVFEVNENIGILEVQFV